MLRCEETFQDIDVVWTTRNKLRTGLVNTSRRQQVDIYCMFILETSKDSTDRPAASVCCQFDQTRIKQKMFSRVLNYLAYSDDKTDATNLPFGLHLHREMAMELFTEYLWQTKAQQRVFFMRLPAVVCTVNILRMQPQEKPAPAGELAILNKKLQEKPAPARTLIFLEEVQPVGIAELADVARVIGMYLGIPTHLQAIFSPLHG